MSVYSFKRAAGRAATMVPRVRAREVSARSSSPLPVITHPPVALPGPPYTRLFSPLPLSGRHPQSYRGVLPHRALMGPLYLGIESQMPAGWAAGGNIAAVMDTLLRRTSSNKEFTAALAEFYAERARGGWLGLGSADFEGKPIEPIGPSLMVAGGVAPAWHGRWRRGAIALNSIEAAETLAAIPRAVHDANPRTRVLLQAFHAGRSALRRIPIAASRVPSKANPYHKYGYLGPRVAGGLTIGLIDGTPRALPSWLASYVASEYERFAYLAELAGFDGIELPLSEGSLLHNFISRATNTRSPGDLGGDIEGRLEIVRLVLSRIKEGLTKPENFMLAVRLCVHDLRPDGNTMAETFAVAELLVKCGIVDIITTSVGMHDSPVQTMAAYVPHGCFSAAVGAVRRHLHEAFGSALSDTAPDGTPSPATGHYIPPIIASHRIATASEAEALIARGDADGVSFARPFLADSAFLTKAHASMKEQATTPCIGCGHCIDKLYKHQRVECAVNPRAVHELERGLAPVPVMLRKRIGVVGAGPAGVMCALTLADRGHEVLLYEKEPYIGGQLNWAVRIPGKEDYYRLIEHWVHQLRQSTRVHCRFGTEFTEEELSRCTQRLDALVLCTGSIFRQPSSHICPGTSDCPILCSIPDVLSRRVIPGRRVAIMGNGAHAYDVASYLAHDHAVTRSSERYCEEFGIDLVAGTLRAPEDEADSVVRNNRDIVIYERPEHDADLAWGKGWFQKRWAKMHNIDVIRVAHYNYIEKDGIRFSTVMGTDTGAHGHYHVVDTIIFAYGMLPNFRAGMFVREWVKDGAVQRGMTTSDFGIYMAGSCRDADTSLGQGEQDLLRAIHEGYEVGAKI